MLCCDFCDVLRFPKASVQHHYFSQSSLRNASRSYRTRGTYTCSMLSEYLSVLSSLPDSPRCKVPSDFCLNLTFRKLLMIVAGTALMKINSFRRLTQRQWCCRRRMLSSYRDVKMWTEDDHNVRLPIKRTQSLIPRDSTSDMASLLYAVKRLVARQEVFQLACEPFEHGWQYYVHFLTKVVSSEKLDRLGRVLFTLH